MENNVRKDKRFSHIASDPRFKRIPKAERKVKIDKRFQSMFSDGRFKLKYTVDKRGRPGDHTSSEDLKRYYDLSSDESVSDTSDDTDDSEDDEVQKRKEKSLTETTKTQQPLKSDESDLESGAASSDEGVIVKEKVDKIETLSEEVKEKLRDSNVDYARGNGILISDSSSDEESSEGELEADVRELDHEWGELDKYAEHTEEITSRLALCNMDWDRIRCSDLMVLFNSFLPPGGLILSVKIYPSDFGMERMKQEEESGPVELLKNEDDINKDGSIRPEDESEEGTKYHMEKLRQYQLIRLKYFYAVITFDSAASANKVYVECDGMEYESSSTRLDLRFIPDDTTFDQEPREECDRMPEPSKYAPRLFTTTALQQAKVELTWDETDPARCEITQKIKAGTADDVDLKFYLASSSGEEDEPSEVVEPEGSDDDDDEAPGQKPADPIAKYRALLQGIEDDEENKKNRGVEMEVTWGLGLKDKTQKLVNKKMKEGKEGLTPFQELLEKKKDKKRLKREERRKKTEQRDAAENSDDASSDDDIPSDIDMNDPYFAEERNNDPKSNKTKKKKKKKHHEEEEDEETKQKKAELELLLMEEHEDRNHFSLKQIQESEAGTSGSKKKRKKMKWKAEKEAKANDVDDFQVDVKDDRFSALFSSHHYNIDPADPHYRKTKGMEALRSEKLNRRVDQEVAGEEVPLKKTKVDVNQKKDQELSLLVKSIKRKTLGKFKT